MPAKAIKKETIKKNTVAELKKLGIFKPEYDRVIEVYADICEQYLAVKKQMTESSYAVRSPTAISLENLRRDVLSYATQLGLTPAGLKKIVGEVKAEKKSKLDEALKKYG